MIRQLFKTKSNQLILMHVSKKAGISEQEPREKDNFVYANTRILSNNLINKCLFNLKKK